MHGQGRVVLYNDFAIELGSQTTRIFVGNFSDAGFSSLNSDALSYISEAGIVLEEPSLVAVDLATREIAEAGSAALQLVEESPSKYRIEHPIQFGVIADERLARHMLRRFLRPHIGQVFSRSRAIVTVPLSATRIERVAVRDAVKRAGMHTVYMIPSSLAAAIGSGLVVTEPEGVCTILADAQYCEAAIISLGTIMAHADDRSGFDAVENAIVNLLRREYGMSITPSTATNIVRAMPQAVNNKNVIEVKGKSLRDQDPCSAYLEYDEIRFAIDAYIEQVAEVLRRCMVQARPETSCDIADAGISLVGPGATLDGLASALESRFAVPVNVPAAPIHSVVSGAGACLATIGTVGSKDLFLVV